MNYKKKELKGKNIFKIIQNLNKLMLEQEKKEMSTEQIIKFGLMK